MNRFFIPGEARMEIPRRAHARLDQIEPEPGVESEHIVFSFDAVDADWPGLGPDGFFSLTPNVGAGGPENLAAHWQARFAGRQIPGADPFDDLPIFRIEVTLRRNDGWTEAIQEIGERWVDIELHASGELEADIFGGLFAAPVTAYLQHPPRPSPQAERLDAVFDMKTWPDATDDELDRALDLKCTLDQLILFDIGQGSALALLCACGMPVGYFDLGCGVFRNAPTCPPAVHFCDCDNPPVILSHWDADHWGGAAKDPKFLQREWIAPRQSISGLHTTHANNILAAGGRVHIVPTNAPLRTWTKNAQTFQLCRGSGRGRNRSGLILTVEDQATQRGWLLTGDAGYNNVTCPLPADLSAVAVPHHGADMGPASLPPSPAPGYTRLLYSFGPGNAHGRTGVGHPRPATVAAHTNAGWATVAWSNTNPGDVVAQGNTLATAAHNSGHLDGAAAGWAGPPVAPSHLSGCAAALPIGQV